MVEFLIDYGLFFAKTATVVLAFVVIIVIVSSKKQSQSKDSIEINKLNEKFDNMALALNNNILSKSELKKNKKKIKKSHKSESAQEELKRIYVVNFHGDIRASALSSFREEITAILTVATKSDEVFVRLDSGGGVVNAYGLAASQLMRIREKEIPLTVAVDKIAASGGYMMACVANKIIAAPFAIIGSIGVLAQIPNFNKVLKKHDIDYEQFTAGEFKRTVTIFGENTNEAKIKFKQEVEDIHTLFKDFINQNRPKVDIAKVSTGEHWPGIRALEHELVDELKTSDDYLLEHSKQADIFEIKYITKKQLIAKIGSQFQRLIDRIQYMR